MQSLGPQNEIVQAVSLLAEKTNRFALSSLCYVVFDG